MIYNIGLKISSELPGLWKEGSPYSIKNIYSKKPGKLPPVNYDEHSFKPHSLTHSESGKHTDNSGLTLDVLIEQYPEYFFGQCLHIAFEKDYRVISENNFLCEITEVDIDSKIKSLGINKIPGKILISNKNSPVNKFGYHLENYVFVLDESGAEYLCNIEKFHLFGTTWKSTDYNPGEYERPIHEKIFQKGIIFELLNLHNVPEGEYIFSGMPLWLENASESPCTPILISGDMVNQY
ncbi:MAG: hypothetical protein KIT33_11705 [Candidatus Kapabacteria bacterium]|nr:hypothetical protein [Ignavibacteriota bacterium]MCW5885625.1 hypothetical protein [Candidatus Kapabacteria bacterium]